MDDGHGDEESQKGDTLKSKPQGGGDGEGDHLMEPEEPSGDEELEGNRGDDPMSQRAGVEDEWEGDGKGLNHYFPCGVFP